MLVGRLTKEPTDLRRATVDFSCWLDQAEVISGFTAPVITALPVVAPAATAWGQAVPPPPGPDLNPLIVQSSFLLPGNQMVQFFFAGGTPGMVYRAAFIATGSSNRKQTVELQVTVVEAANAAVQ